jgi:hypothetical protein
MIASKQACFTKQINIFIERKMIQATTQLACAAMCIGKQASKLVL